MRVVHQCHKIYYAQQIVFFQSCMDDILSVPEFLSPVYDFDEYSFMSQGWRFLRKLPYAPQSTQ